MSESISGSWKANLADLIEMFGDDGARRLVSEFSCPRNPDVEDFLRQKAIPFCHQGISATHLVYKSFQKETVLVGYYALANKMITVKASAFNSRWRQRMNRFATYQVESKSYVMAMPLIGQLGKNFAKGYDSLISGKELLDMACSEVRKMQRAFGGKMVYLECENVPGLIKFYTDNGFVEFGRRTLGTAEQGLTKTPYLIQMIRYFEEKQKI